MDLFDFVERLRRGSSPKFPSDANSLEFAQKLDSQDSIRHLRDEFIIPTKRSLRKKALDGSIPGESGVIGAFASSRSTMSESLLKFSLCVVSHTFIAA